MGIFNQQATQILPINCFPLVPFIINVAPFLILGPGLTKVFQTLEVICESNRSSTRLPLSTVDPYILAGMTLLSLNTNTSPRFKYSVIS